MVILEAPAEPRSLELKGMNTKDENLEAKINKKSTSMHTKKLYDKLTKSDQLMKVNKYVPVHPCGPGQLPLTRSAPLRESV